MKKTTILLISLLGLLLPATAWAGKADKGAKGKKNSQTVTARQVLRKFDKNGNGKIDGEEVEALRKAFNGPRHDALKALDKNKDGKLDDSEIAAIKADKHGKKSEKQERKKKEK